MQEGACAPNVPPIAPLGKHITVDPISEKKRHEKMWNSFGLFLRCKVYLNKAARAG